MSILRPIAVAGTVAVLVSSYAFAQRALVTIPYDLNAGDKYRLIFVTSTTCTGTSNDIINYNSFVSDVVSRSGLSVLGGTWRAVVSTSAIDAADNIGASNEAPPQTDEVYFGQR